MLINYIRTLILYCVVVVAMRLMGKKQVGQLQPSEFVISLMLSELASVPMQDTAIPLFYGIIPIFTLVAVEIAVSVLSLKSRRARSLLEGDAVIIIKHGVLQCAQMKRMRYNLNDVTEELRRAAISDIRQVEYAILETDGSLSVVPKSVNRALTAEDVSLSLPSEPFYFTVISDGKYDNEALANAGLTREQIDKKLKRKGISSEKKVFFGAADERGSFYGQLYDGGRII